MALCQPGSLGAFGTLTWFPQALFLLFLPCTCSTNVHALLAPTIYVHASSTLHPLSDGQPDVSCKRREQ